jgi:hypothetical protein
VGRNGGKRDGKALDPPLVNRKESCSPLLQPHLVLKQGQVYARSTRFFLYPYTSHTGWVNLGAFLPHTGWVKHDAFLLHTGWVKLSASCRTQGGSTAGRRPPCPSEFPAPDPKKEKEVQLHPLSEEPLKMMDMCNHTYQMIKGLRWVLENH